MDQQDMLGIDALPENRVERPSDKDVVSEEDQAGASKFSKFHMFARRLSQGLARTMRPLRSLKEIFLETVLSSEESEGGSLTHSGQINPQGASFNTEGPSTSPTSPKDGTEENKTSQMGPNVLLRSDSAVPPP